MILYINHDIIYRPAAAVLVAAAGGAATVQAVPHACLSPSGFVAHGTRQLRHAAGIPDVSPVPAFTASATVHFAAAAAGSASAMHIGPGTTSS